MTLFVVDRAIGILDRDSRAYTHRGIGRAVVLREGRPLSVGTIVPTEEMIHRSDSLVRNPYAVRWDRDGFLMPSRIHEDPDHSIGCRAPHLRRAKAVDDVSYVEKFERNLEIFVAMAEAAGIRPVLMTQPSRLTADPDEVVEFYFEYLANPAGYGLPFTYPQYRRLHGLFNETVRKLGARRGIPVVDLDRAVPKESRFLYDVFHFTAEGNELVAATISRTLVPQLRPQAAQPSPRPSGGGGSSRLVGRLPEAPVREAGAKGRCVSIVCPRDRARRRTVEGAMARGLGFPEWRRGRDSNPRKGKPFT